ncbi:hypothetical protein EF731_23950 [Salmonella enterica subsp. enterica serovar Derby]|nr:hypothetical protein [Salmonella enterica subsp. enterica serovar Derby]
MQQRLHCTGIIYQLICCAMIRPKETGQDVQLQYRRPQRLTITTCSGSPRHPELTENKGR